MEVIVTIQHAGNVHFFKNVISDLEGRGHGVHVFAREQEIVVELLEEYEIDYELLCDEPKGWVDLGLTQLWYEVKLLKHARKIEPDHIVSSHGIAASHVAMLVGAESHIFIDTETAINNGNRLTTPFADNLYTPESFREEYGDNHVTYPGYHELSYLHPNRFEPDPEILRRNGVDPDEPYAVLRFGSFQTNHDIGKEGISGEGRRQIVDELAADGRVFVSDEGNVTLPEEAEALPVSPAAFHHLLAFADLVVGDVATTTLESGVLGVPTIRISPFAGENDMGKFHHLEESGLVRSFPTAREAEGIELVRQLARDPTTGDRWTSRRQAFLEEVIDVSRYVTESLIGEETIEGPGERATKGADRTAEEANQRAQKPGP